MAFSSNLLFNAINLRDTLFKNELCQWERIGLRECLFGQIQEQVENTKQF